MTTKFISERAAIREYDGGSAREDAEREARAEVLAWLRNENVGG